MELKIITNKPKRKNSNAFIYIATFIILFLLNCVKPITHDGYIIPHKYTYVNINSKIIGKI